MRTLILFSGGIDSTVALAMALEKKHECLAISFDYNQRHKVELKAAKEIAKFYSVPHQIIKIDPSPFSHSSLVNPHLDSPIDRTATAISSAGIPNTYVPGRNTLFLAYSLSLAEMYNSEEIVIGANAVDGNPYPDCRPNYFNAFQSLANLSSKQAVEGRPPKITTPLLFLAKKEIIGEGIRLKAPLEKTFSCYSPTNEDLPCNRCDACMLRKEGFSSILQV